MWYLLLAVISYGSFLLLLTPLSTSDLLSTLLVFALGAALIVYKKPFKTVFWKTKRYLFPISLASAACMGLKFVGRCRNYEKAERMAERLHISVGSLSAVLAVILSVLSVYFVYGALRQILAVLTDRSEEHRFRKTLLCFVFSAVTVVCLSQIMSWSGFMSMGLIKFFFNCLTVVAIVLILWALTGSARISVLLGGGVCMVISTVNVYVYSFRYRLFEPSDIFSAKAAMNVAESYSLLPIPPRILFGWFVFAVLFVFLCIILPRAKPALSWKRRLAVMMAGIIGMISVFVCAGTIKPNRWYMEGALHNGYILDFVSKLDTLFVTEPDHYDTEQLDALAERYSAEESSPDTEEKPPHIIVIMDEAFSDLSILGEVATDTEVMPFISSLKENTVSGYALSSVYGGNTANSEYEFLTGNSMAWLSANTVPYQQYVRSSAHSMVSYLKSAYQYKCIAMHPYKSSGWNRTQAYEFFGFDEQYYIEDFPNRDLVREFISDREMFAFLIDAFEEKKEEPLFFFGVTMQNHGDYNYDGENFTQHVSLTEHEGYPDVEQYLSLIHETDKAVEELIEYFTNVDEEVVIVLFGDHQPRIDADFYEKIAGKTPETLTELQQQYIVPFFIWTNYDIEEQYVECTSLNYLSSYAFEAAGIDLPLYCRFLQDMEAVVPSINANGFYSTEQGEYLSFDMANPTEREWLDLYEALQYNNIFDTKHKNKLFFPPIG